MSQPDALKQSPRMLYFAHLKQTQSQITGSINSLRATLTRLFDARHQVLQALVKDEAARGPTLLWFARALAGCAKRAQMNAENQLSAQGVIQGLGQPQIGGSVVRFRAMAEYMQLCQMEGSGAAGFSLNVGHALLALAKPIKDHSGIDTWYVVRDDDYARMLLAPLREVSKHGDEAACTDALEDEGYVTSLTAEPSFKTQVFWLSAYAIHTVLLPQIKYATSFLQAGGHFQASGNQNGSHDCIGEFFCFDVVVRDPAFVERLAHG
jgi:hypothetical protein